MATPKGPRGPRSPLARYAPLIAVVVVIAIVAVVVGIVHSDKKGKSSSVTTNANAHGQTTFADVPIGTPPGSWRVRFTRRAAFGC